MYSIKITVFTPVYNRKHTLYRVYESLAQQTFKDFEWVIVDDGSTDDVYDLISEWEQSAFFPVRYFYQENGGKHNAINKGVDLAKGEFFIIADSDDRFIPESLKIFHDTWNTIPIHKQPEYAGVWVLCKDEKNDIVPDLFPSSPWDCNTKERLFIERISGEKWHMEKTQVLKEFPFPPIKLKGFYYGEGNIWLQVNKKYKFRCINVPLRTYYKSNDGIMENMRIDVFMGSYSSYISLISFLNNTIEYFWYAPINYLTCMLLIQKYSIELKIPLLKTFKETSSFWIKIIYISCLLLLPFVFIFKLLKKTGKGRQQ